MTMKLPMKLLLKLGKLLAVLLVLGSLAACGGGGGNRGGVPLGGDADTDADRGNQNEPAEPVVTKTFSLGLKDVTVKRLSNGELVEVDTAGVNSGTLTLQ